MTYFSVQFSACALLNFSAFMHFDSDILFSSVLQTFLLICTRKITAIFLYLVSFLKNWSQSL